MPVAHAVMDYADLALQLPVPPPRLEPDLLIQQLPQLSSAPPMAGKCATIRNSHKHTSRQDTPIKSLGIIAFIQTCCEGLTCQAVAGSSRTKMCGGSSVPENGTCVEDSSLVSICPEKCPPHLTNSSDECHLCITTCLYEWCVHKFYRRSDLCHRRINWIRPLLQWEC